MQEQSSLSLLTDLRHHTFMQICPKESKAKMMHSVKMYHYNDL